MQIIIHRGAQQIGGTCVEVISFNGSRIIMDVGMPLDVAQGNAANEQLGLYPAVEGLFSGEKKINGVFISHAHQDHYGLLSAIKPEITCFCGKATKKLIELTALHTNRPIDLSNTTTFSAGEKMRCGDFTITPYLMDHSSFDAYAFLIQADGKRLFYSGDFRGHGRKGKLLEAFLSHPPERVDALLLEGTMMGRGNEQCLTEPELENHIAAKLSGSDKIAFACVSGQNIDRLVTLFRAARRCQRQVIIDPYVADVLETVNEMQPSIPALVEGFRKNLGVLYTKQACRKMRLYLRQGDKLDQWESYRAYQADFAQKPSRYLVLVRPGNIDAIRESTALCSKDALFLYGQWMGYWEKDTMKNLRGWVEEQHMEFIYAHTSGHATKECLQQFVQNLNPHCVIPIHTERPAAYDDLFKEKVKILHDGESWFLG